MLNGFSHTKIITSHDLDMICDVCKRVIVINNGHLQADGPVDEIMTNKALLEANGMELPLSMQKCDECGYKNPLKEK